MVKDEHYYRLLGIEPGATSAEIKRAYKLRAKELHPDKTGGDPDKEALFKQVKTAYEVLIDPVRRKEYDVSGYARATPLELEAVGILNGLFAGLIDQLMNESMNQGGPMPSLPPHSVGNTVQAIVDQTNVNINQHRRVIINCGKIIEKIEKLRDKVDFDGKGRNLFIVVLDEKINLIAEQRVDKEHMIKVNKEMLKILKHYKDKVDEEVAGRISFSHHFFPTGGSIR